jgi:hypothetical protein
VHRILAAAAVAAAALSTLVFTPTSAVASTPGDGWFRAIQGPFADAAGQECDFPVSGANTVDQVYGKTTQTFPDGTPKQQIFAGPLIYTVTNTDNGRSHIADASGTAVIDYAADGSQVWYVVGPVILNARTGRTNLPRGIWVVNGIYTLAFDASGHGTVTLIHGTEHNVCTDIS